MSVARCQQEVSAEEFVYWLAYDRLEPIGPERNDFYLAQVCACVMNTTRKKNSDKVWSSKDFMMQWQGSQQSVAEMQNRLRMSFEKSGIKFIEAD